ncbi:HNH endonuclease [Mycobacterium phage Optimus]|uniref:HNH endonuclease n=2 Tax=root TaxID=1 RepID=G1DAJ0_9CAUD|nr:endonuclease VII [Mycobacterium phage Wanda]YP_009590907.1 endonuclease VII [Mycobacterium phage Optimus]ATN88856.1 HNH endonuclease [Mycobacterium phage DmpstrDiver]KZA06336.1 HNH endonuclease [Acinetobacter baumannii]AEJ92131.1 HNH endonuclease [Mycobacterium phage Optimus]AGT11756.1 HNH endonuclease [Mycobacterium phage Wanda]
MEQAHVKACSKCKAVKPVDRFNRAPDKRSGLSSQCKDCIKERAARHYAENRERLLRRNKEWAEANPEKAREVRRRSVQKNREQRKLYAREYRKRRPDITKAAERRWRENNPEAYRAYETRKTARRRSAYQLADFAPEQLEARWNYYGGNCWMCGEPATSIDHVKPIAKGGAHMLCNLRPACKPCNSRKGGRWPL